MLQQINNGIAYYKDRRSGPYVIPIYMGYPSSEDDLINPSNLTFDQVDRLISDGLVEEKCWGEFCCLLFTYKGRLQYLKSIGWTFDKWSMKQYACCEKAVPVYCVCRVSTNCPDHGMRCNGSHD